MSAADHLGIQFQAVHGAYSSTHYAYLPGHQEHAGFASVNHIKNEPVEVSALRVSDQHQHQGIGRALMDHVIGEYGHQDMELYANPFGNEALNRSRLREFYGSMGFQQDKHGEAGMMTRRAR